MKTRTKRLLPYFVGLTGLLGVGASASFYFRPHGNTNLVDGAPSITAIHVILGGIWLAIAPFQFVKRIRNKRLQLHRQMGRFLTVIGTVVGFTAALLALLVPFSGWSERIIITPFAIFFSVAMLIGFWHVRNKRIQQHKAWMARAFSIGLSIGTMRLFFTPGLIWLIRQAGGYPATDDISTVSIVSFTLAFVVHIIGVEWWIRQQ